MITIKDGRRFFGRLEAVDCMRNVVLKNSIEELPVENFSRINKKIDMSIRKYTICPDLEYSKTMMRTFTSIWVIWMRISRQSSMRSFRRGWSIIVGWSSLGRLLWVWSCRRWKRRRSKGGRWWLGISLVVVVWDELWFWLGKSSVRALRREWGEECLLFTWLLSMRSAKWWVNWVPWSIRLEFLDKIRAAFPRNLEI